MLSSRTYHMVGVKFPSDSLLTRVEMRTCTHDTDLTKQYCSHCGEKVYESRMQPVVRDGEHLRNDAKLLKAAVRFGNVENNQYVRHNQYGHYVVIGDDIPQFCGQPAMDALLKHRLRFLESVYDELKRRGVHDPRGLFGIHLVHYYG